ncbi:MAG: hypothetical protein WBD10_00025 [Acidobacteriaceae bacterium]
MSDPYLRSELQEQVSEDYVRNGVFPPAISIIHKDSALMWQASDDLAKSMLRCGLVAKLTAIAPTLNGSSRYLTLKRIAVWQARHNRATEAQKTAASITDEDVRTDAQLGIIMADSLKSGTTDSEVRLRKLLSSASHSSVSTADLVFQDLALVYAMRGNLNDALAQLSKVSAREKVFSTYYVIEATAEKVRESDASSIGKQVVSMVQPYLVDPDQAYQLSLLAGALADIGSFDAGIRLANSITNEQRKEEALVIISVHLIEANNSERATQVMHTLPPVPPSKSMLEAARQMAWIRFAMAQSNAGNGTAALQALNFVNDPRLESLLRVERGYALATTGRFADAEAAAAQLKESFPNNTRGRALRLIAAVYAHNRGRAEAVQWAATLKSASDRVNAYLGIADGLLGKPAEDIPPYFED